jgi:hypothetical protein
MLGIEFQKRRSPIHLSGKNDVEMQMTIEFTYINRWDTFPDTHAIWNLYNGYKLNIQCGYESFSYRLQFAYYTGGNQSGMTRNISYLVLTA